METMIWGRMTGVRQGLPAQGLWWRNTCPGAALAKEPNPTTPHPEGDRDAAGIPGCVPTGGWGPSGYRDKLDGDRHGQFGSKLVVELLHNQDGRHGNDGSHQGAHIGVWQLLAEIDDSLENTGGGNVLRKADASLAGFWRPLCAPEVSTRGPWVPASPHLPQTVRVALRPRLGRLQKHF